MKKKIGLLAIIGLLVSFMAFSGVASAQASNVHVVFFTSPMCGTCQQVKPLADAAAAKYGIAITYYDVTVGEGKGIATANGVTATPTIVISGAQSARFEGFVTQAQIETAIKAAIGTPTPTKPVVKATPVPVKATPVAVKATPVAVKATPVAVKATPVAVKAVAKTTTQPTIEVVTATQTPTTSTQTATVPEFSLLGLGAPALLIGAIYLFLRRR
jgi:thiol-disulfide isomerase/thioredoxin